MTQIDPAIEVHHEIQNFEKFLKDCGTSFDAILAEPPENDVVATVHKILTDTALEKLKQSYDDLMKQSANILVQIEDEPRFREANLPEPPSLTHEASENVILLISFVYEVRRALQPLIDEGIRSSHQDWFESQVSERRTELRKGFYYEFTEGDLKRIQQLINELRDVLIQSDLFDAAHKQRLMIRLERLQAEMHKRVSDVDRIWGLVGDAGVAIGKFGKDAKPFVDRIKELSQIAWRTQARAEELPSGTENPMLGHDESDDA